MREARLTFSLLVGRPAQQAGKAPLTPAWRPSSVQWRLPARGKACAALELPQWVTPLPRVCGQPDMTPLCCAWAAAQHALRARQRRAPQVHRPAQPQDAHRLAALRARSGRHAPRLRRRQAPGPAGRLRACPRRSVDDRAPAGGAGDRLQRAGELEWRSQVRVAVVALSRAGDGVAAQYMLQCRGHSPSC